MTLFAETISGADLVVLSKLGVPSTGGVATVTPTPQAPFSSTGTGDEMPSKFQIDSLISPPPKVVVGT